MKKIILLTFLSTTLWAQIPNGYYNDASGLTGTSLQQALHDIIDNHTVVSYSSLWTHYQTTDVKPNGKVWDMYSHNPDGDQPYEFTFVSDQCGNYGGEGDCYNREHSWPKSWFNDVSPMNTDIFHVVPSDGYVNGQRGNYPYGEVSSPTWTSASGSKKGPNTYPGYSGTVFEPIDTYKGDFARAYFYMSTRYFNEDGNWPGSPMADGAQLEQWAQDMMMEWHTEDPVSQKEIDRNDDIYNFVQNNRNPFVDHPTYVDLIWGVPPDLPASPGDFVADEITETSLSLSWSDNSDNESGFYIYQDNERIATLGTNTIDYSLDQLQAATTYGFAVTAYNADGESSRATLTVSTTGGGGGTVNHFVEDFETGAGSSYLEGDFTLPSGSWSAYQAGNFSLGTPRSGSKCLSINDDKAGAHITTPAVNTLGTISFYYYQRNGDTGDEFQLQKSVNGAAFQTVSSHSYDVGDTYTLFSAQLNDTSNSIRMRIVNDNQAGHLVIDDLSVTQYDPVSIDDETSVAPSNLSLIPAYPNPFNPEVVLSFQIHEGAGDIQIQIYDIQGQLIDTPIQQVYSPGTYSVTWGGSNYNGEQMPSGMYLVKLSNSQVSQFQRITLIR
ncbi:MAG: T9SS type A sorting domain-containing protein [Candidatus Marinimicrobia bacterium]|jgi:endonuclease I|nr:T9SS type A sorting domain-containing protein [Candidatus Neomarinimicrobiota bacterium]MBT3950959.1 T9SS type A sorting domain-containing protein [Candidatus Neomarinimicrobiota bacterium]MBT4294752.1 T9SS type A sorting domain-containing protein [Candidatus Neomarinimicrobiota bacterium]MBT4420967.1 T9SS type A sorting domain-containing protein [Candidatus Neomarinimicrobiota bacterium]MBT4992694.1 T9SS type A sorting domain-containing protein [Candidatus Neomarinimicrobiota bacterium]